MTKLKIFFLVSLFSGLVYAKENYVIIPDSTPKFPGMIMRPIEGTNKYRWECEYGILTATATVKNNLILESVGCASHHNYFQ